MRARRPATLSSGTLNLAEQEEQLTSMGGQAGYASWRTRRNYHGKRTIGSVAEYGEVAGRVRSIQVHVQRHAP
jgi:hypothetical protein